MKQKSRILHNYKICSLYMLLSGFKRVLMMMYNIPNYWIFGLNSFIHSSILKFHESSLVTTGLGCRTCQITICTVSTNAGK
jgi:hypothetical protein